MTNVRAASWVKIAAIVLAALVSLPFFTAYRFGEPPFLSPIFERSVAPPNEEEYRVYSAFFDDFFEKAPPPEPTASSRPAIILVSAETLPMRGGPSLDATLLGAESAEPDFSKQNAQAWSLSAQSFHTRTTIKLVGGGAAVELKNQLPMEAEGILHVSRIGFDNRNTIALMYYHLRCGNMCAQSGLVVLRKSGSKWHIQEFGPTTVS